MSSNALVHESGFKASYVWPNPAFPFRLYYDGSKCRVFIIENIQHNWNWLLEWREGIRDTDYFFVIGGWYQSSQFAQEAQNIFDTLNLSKENFFLLYNSEEERNNFEPFGFRGQLINQNAWLNAHAVMRCLPETQKEYDAIYVARRSAFKRHMLAANVPDLALIVGANHGNNISDIPDNRAYINDAPLKPDEVCEKINQSYCGLILSAVEGACFASSEYLLCGVPVVSTPSQGGRDVWYNEYNSIICDPTPEAVAEAVGTLKERRPDPREIRKMHMDEAVLHRQRFVIQLQRVFDRFGVTDTDAPLYFRDHYQHKLRASQRPDFAALFPH